jgi:hypothetical protein
MTYRELYNELGCLTDEQLNQTVTVFLVEQDEYMSLAENFPTATSNEDCDQLDPDHFYLRV